MYKIRIRKPVLNDKEDLFDFFNLMVKHTFEKNGYGHMSEAILEETKSKKMQLMANLNASEEARYFLVAEIDGKLIGSISYGPAGHAIIECSEGKYSDEMEIGGVFIHPDYQGKGLCQYLMNSIYLTMIGQGYKGFVLDSGYKTAQRIWRHKYGEADIFVKDYWDIGVGHMVWKIEFDDLEVQYAVGVM